MGISSILTNIYILCYANKGATLEQKTLVIKAV